jgi:hypothetical protein
MARRAPGSLGFAERPTSGVNISLGSRLRRRVEQSKLAVAVDGTNPERPAAQLLRIKPPLFQPLALGKLFYS